MSVQNTSRNLDNAVQLATLQAIVPAYLEYLRSGEYLMTDEEEIEEYEEFLNRLNLVDIDATADSEVKECEDLLRQGAESLRDLLHDEKLLKRVFEYSSIDAEEQQMLEQALARLCLFTTLSDVHLLDRAVQAVDAKFRSCRRELVHLTDRVIEGRIVSKTVVRNETCALLLFLRALRQDRDLKLNYFEVLGIPIDEEDGDDSYEFSVEPDWRGDVHGNEETGMFRSSSDEFQDEIDEQDDIAEKFDIIWEVMLDLRMDIAAYLRANPPA